jgi:hypothetical protein
MKRIIFTSLSKSVSCGHGFHATNDILMILIASSYKPEINGKK